MKEDVQKLIENTIKDMLLGNTALTLLFAIPIAFIAKSGLTPSLWILALFVAPSMLAVVVFVVTRIDSYADSFFKSTWAKRSYVVYTLVSTEFMLIYSVLQLGKALTK